MHLTDLRNDIRLNGLVEIGENLQRHQVFDELEGLEAEFLGQRLHGDRRLDVEDFFPRHLFVGCFGLRRLGYGRFLLGSGLWLWFRCWRRRRLRDRRGYERLDERLEADLIRSFFYFFNRLEQVDRRTLNLRLGSWSGRWRGSFSGA